MLERFEDINNHYSDYRWAWSYQLILDYYHLTELDQAACERIRPDQLRDRPMTFTNAPAYNAMLNRIFERYDVQPIVHSYANDDTAMFGMVRADAAVFITSDYPQIYSNGLAIRRLDQDVCQREICVAYTQRSFLNPTAAALIAFIRARANAEA